MVAKINVRVLVPFSYFLSFAIWHVDFDTKLEYGSRLNTIDSKFLPILSIEKSKKIILLKIFK